LLLIAVGSIFACLSLGLFLLPDYAIAEDPPQAGSITERSEQGQLIVSVEDDFVSDECRKRYLLKTDDGRIIKLKGDQLDADKLSTFSTVRAVGRMGKDPYYRSQVLELSDFEVLAEPQMQESVLAAAPDVRRAILIRVNFTDAAVECSVAEIGSLMWTGSRNVDGWYQEASFGQMMFTSDTDGNGQPDVVDVNIPRATSEGECDPHGWASAANTAAQALGVNLSLYQHKVYVLPKKAPCSWAGYAYVGCWSSCTAWTKYCNLPDVLTHELGHNVSMHHSSTDTNNDGVIDSEYGDYSCPMGIGGVGYRHFNAVQKARMGWIPDERIKTVGVTFEYDIALTELDPATLPNPSITTQVLKVAVPYDEPWEYYVSYRVPEGNYSVNLRSAYANKINIHRRQGTSSRSLFLDAIDVGETWQDGNGVEVSFLSKIDTYYARVKLTVPPTGRRDQEPAAPMNLRIAP
jgi:hypothetical protein